MSLFPQTGRAVREGPYAWPLLCSKSGTTSSSAADSTTFRSVDPLSEMSSACWSESALAEGSVGEQDYSIPQVKWLPLEKTQKRLSAALTLSLAPWE